MAARGLAVPLGSVHGAFSGARFRGARRRWRDLARWGLDFALFTQFALFPFFALAHLWCTVPQAFEDKINYEVKSQPLAENRCLFLKKIRIGGPFFKMKPQPLKGSGMSIRAVATLYLVWCLLYYIYLATRINGPRDVPQCGALSLLQKPLHYRGIHQISLLG
jgi:hypothetical protein